MKMKKVFSLLVIICVSALLFEAVAQCPMCKVAAESNLKNGGTMGKGLNTGILYMFAMPYLLVSFLGYIWYKNKRLYVDDQTPSPADKLQSEIH